LILRAGIERAIKRDDIDVSLADTIPEQGFSAADFTGPGEEDQRRAGFGAQRALDGVCSLAFDWHPGITA